MLDYKDLHQIEELIKKHNPHKKWNSTNTTRGLPLGVLDEQDLCQIEVLLMKNRPSPLPDWCWWILLIMFFLFIISLYGGCRMTE